MAVATAVAAAVAAIEILFFVHFDVYLWLWLPPNTRVRLISCLSWSELRRFQILYLVA